METYYGLVRTPADAIKLFEACRLGIFPRVQRRLSEKERQSIRSGSVFVWDEREAGMRRWTDGKSWSASRVSGSFLTYREMEGKRGGGFGSSRKGAGKTPESGRGSDEDQDDGEPDGYRYKADGLMKQSFSITTSAGQHLHLISYFTKSHSQSNELPQPSTDPQLRHLIPAKGLYPESSWSDSSAAAPAIARAAMATGQYIMPQPQPQAVQQTMHHQYPPHPAKHHQGYSWPLSPVTTPPYSNGHAGTHYSTAPPPQPHPSEHHHQAPPPNSYVAPYPPSSNRLPPPAMLLHQQPHAPSQPQYPSPMTPHHSQPPPHTPQYTQAPHTSRPVDSPRVQHLQAAAAQAVTNLPNTTPPPRNQSASPPRSAHSDGASGTTSYATSTPSTASNKPSLSTLLLHPVGEGTAGGPPRGVCSDKSMTEDARALRVLDRKFCI
ncbi:hypothetical protein VUR80DRAFT_6187 [Thermomyces stellatus]